MLKNKELKPMLSIMLGVAGIFLSVFIIGIVFSVIGLALGISSLESEEGNKSEIGISVSLFGILFFFVLLSDVTGNVVMKILAVLCGVVFILVIFFLFYKSIYAKTKKTKTNKNSYNNLQNEYKYEKKDELVYETIAPTYEKIYDNGKKENKNEIVYENIETENNEEKTYEQNHIEQNMIVSIEEQRNNVEIVRQNAEELIDNMEGHDFEYFCADVLQRQGYENVEVTKSSGDQGVDVLAERDGIRYAVQCKRYSQSVGNKAVQEIYAGKKFYHCHVGIVMTNNYFTQSAKDLAREDGIILWDKDYLIRFLEMDDSFEFSNKKMYNSNTASVFGKNNEKFAQKKMEKSKMYDKEKGIYPPGVYVVGDDIEIGKYLLKAKKGEYMDPMIAFYETYSAYRKEEINQLERFDDDYYLSLRENGMVIAVRDADMKKI